MHPDYDSRVISERVVEESVLTLPDACVNRDGTTSASKRDNRPLVSTRHAQATAWKQRPIVDDQIIKTPLSTVHIQTQGSDTGSHTDVELLSDEGYESATPPSATTEQKAQPPLRPCDPQAMTPTNAATKKNTTRRVSYPSAEASAKPVLAPLPYLTCNPQDHSNRLKALLLPEMVRAKGVRLVSPTEFTSLNRLRSYSEPMNDWKNHRRTLSMPAEMYIRQHTFGPHLSGNNPFHVDAGSTGYKRNIDLDTSDEPVTFPSIYLIEPDDDGTEGDKKEKEEKHTERSPLAGNDHSFRGHFDNNTTNFNNNGTFDKPLMIIYQHDPFFSPFPLLDYVTTKKEYHDDSNKIIREEVIIESWIVEEDDLSNNDIGEFYSSSYEENLTFPIFEIFEVDERHCCCHHDESDHHYSQLPDVDFYPSMPYAETQQFNPIPNAQESPHCGEEFQARPEVEYFQMPAPASMPFIPFLGYAYEHREDLDDSRWDTDEDDDWETVYSDSEQREECDEDGHEEDRYVEEEEAEQPSCEEKTRHTLNSPLFCGLPRFEELDDRGEEGARGKKEE